MCKEAVAAWEDAFSEEKIKRGWAQEGIVPLTRRLYWELRDEEKATGLVPSAVSLGDISAFNLKMDTASLVSGESSSSAIIAATSTAMTVAEEPDAPSWDLVIDDEVEALLRAERGDATLNVPAVPAPTRIPKLTSALLFKLPGGVSGDVGTALIRAKEVERRLNIARTEANKAVREGKRAVQSEQDWSLAAQSLVELKENSFVLSKLSKGQLLSLVRALNLG